MTRETASETAFLSGGGEMGALMRAHDWAATPLGPPQTWPQGLKTSVRMALTTRHPIFIFWGEEHICLYNDGYRPSLGPEKHPSILGGHGYDAFAEIWDIIGPQIDMVMRGEGATWHENQLVPTIRNGAPQEIYWTYSYGPIDDETAQSGVGGVLVVCNETTQQVLAERRAKADREHLAEMFEQAPGIVALLEGPDHVFALTNAAYRELIGDREVVDQPLRAALPEVQGQGFVELLDHVFASGAPFRGEAVPVRLARKPGQPDEERFVDFIYQPITDADGHVAGIFVEGSDVTERVRGEAKLRDSETRFRAIFEQASDYIFTADLNQVITSCNPSGAAALGYPAEEIVGRSIAEFLDPGEFERTSAMVKEKLKVGGSTRYAVTIVAKDGRRLTWEINSALTAGVDGKPIGLHVLARDMTEARATADRLRASEDRLRRAQEAGGIGSYEWDLATGAGRQSDSMLRIAGLEPGRARTLKEIMAPVLAEDRPRIIARLEAVGRGIDRDETDYRIRRPSDGEVRWIRDIGQVERDEAGQPVRWVGIVQDVTERKEAEIGLRESEERHRFALKAGRMGWWSLDVAAGELTASGTCKLNFGRDPHAPFTYADLRAAIHPEDAERMAGAVERSLATGTDYDIEYRILTPSGVRWVGIRAQPTLGPDGRVSSLSGVSLDITDRKVAEEAVRERAAELETVLDAVPAAIWIARDSESRVIDGNRFARELLRMKPDANISKSAPDADANVGHFRICGTDGEELSVDDLPVQTAARGEIVRDFEERIVFDDGSTVDLIGNAAPLTDANGRIRGSVAAFVDVTAMKAVEAELRELTEALETRVAETVAEREAAFAQLHEAQKLETLGQLTGGVAHDFNNLLTPIVGSLDLLRRRLPADPKAERLIDGALQAADRARTLVSRLLAFGRRQVLQPRPTDIATLLHGITDLIQRSIGHHINVVVEPASSLPAARVDPNQLELALLNLAVNARDAMPGGGTITITAHPDAVAPRNEPGLRPGSYVRLSVIDTGTGMDEATCKRAIEPFFTTKGVGKGTGLGLSMIHGLAGQMGGALRLSSTVGIGTRVDLWLPVAEAAAEAPVEISAAPVRKPAQAATILLVDDEELVRLGAAEMLSELGYAVIEAGSGAEALEIVEGGASVDAIVTDYLMPGMNGGELIEAARNLRPGLPALIVSGYATLNGLDPSVPLLAKPFRHDAFAEAVAALLDAKIIPFPRAAAITLSP